MPSASTIIAACVMLTLLMAITRRVVTASVLFIALFALLLLGSLVKQHYLGLALTAADLQFFFTRPAENLKLFLNYPTLGGALASVAIAFASIVFFGWRWEKPIRLFLAGAHGKVLRLLTAVAAIGVGLLSSMVSSTSHAERANDGDAYSAFFALGEMQHPDGWIGRLNVFFNNRELVASLPAARKQETFPVPAPGGQSRSSTDIPPDIFMVLEESTFDPQLSDRCAFPQCDVAMMHPLPVAARSTESPLLVHTTGGGTWLAEFAFLSGFDWRIFGRAGAFAPISLAPRLQMSLPRYLHALGYRTIALSPIDADFMSARSAYRHYGFDEYYSGEDLHTSSDWHEIYDRVVFDKALALARDRRDDRPLFIFALTIRNHGPHGDASSRVPDSYRQIQRAANAELADYLARLNDSSRDYMNAARQWLDSPRPRVIGWFGDHQPEMAWDLLGEKDLNNAHLAANVGPGQIKYITRYQLSANYGDRQQGASARAVDIAFLSSELLAFAQLPLDAGSLATRTVASRCDGLLLDCKDATLVNDYLSYRIHELKSVE
jgi:phosphoglycerol transferase MdoB-like AlkP superfamily enzyme